MPKKSPSVALDGPVRARAKRVDATIREEQAIQVYREHLSYQAVAEAMGVSVRQAKRWVRKAGKGLAEVNESAVLDLAVREEERDEAQFQEIWGTFSGEDVDPADKAKLSDSLVRLRDRGIRWKEKLGILPTMAPPEETKQTSVVLEFGLDRVQRAAVSMTVTIDRERVVEEEEAIDV